MSQARKEVLGMAREKEMTEEEEERIKKFVDDNYEKLKAALKDPDYAKKVADMLKEQHE
jgi:hypothetical protein